MAQSLQNAPFTKGVLFVTTAASIFAQAVRATPRSSRALLQAAFKLVAFQTPGELVFGAFLIYYFRVLERQAGTAKFAAFAAGVTGVASIIQALLLRALPSEGSTALGPYAYIFACLVQFYLNIPASSKFTVAGFRLSDKTFTYLAGLQLLLVGGRSTLLAGAAGIIAGCLYKVNFLGLKKLRFPAAVTSFFANTIGLLLRDTPQQQDAAGATHGASGSRSRSAQQHQGRGHAPHAQHPHARQGQPQQHQQQHQPSEEALQRLMEMGFERSQAAMALQATNNDVDMAITLLVG